MQERHINFHSQILNRNIDLLVSGHYGYPMLMFPTSMGTFYQNKDMGLLDVVGGYVAAGKIKLYNVGSIDFDTFYAKHLNASDRIYNYNLYVWFLKNELIPAIQRECGVHRIGVAGCSFGGYHAANLAFRFPDLFDNMFSMSGAFNIKSFMGNYYDDNVYHNNPVDFMNNVEGWKFNHINIVLGTSEWDICRKDNLEMSQLLNAKGINHWYDQKGWAAHDWPLWKQMFGDYISKLNF